MKRHFFKRLVFVVLLSWCLSPSFNMLAQSVNNRKTDKTEFNPVFELVYTRNKPELKLNYEWLTKSLLASWVLPGTEERTFDVSKSGETFNLTGISQNSISQNETEWQFSENQYATLTAKVEKTNDGYGEKLSWKITAKKEGWFALGYNGAEVTDYKKVRQLFQPLIWQERRIPTDRYVSAETYATFPGVLVETNGKTYGLIPEPDAIPFRMPTLENSMFGLVLRAQGDKEAVHPVIYAPLMGTEHSYLKAGESRSFSIRLIHSETDLKTTRRELITGLYQFENKRQNATGSLNETIENMIRFQMDDRYSGWNADLKGYDYKEDVYGTVKVVSSLQALSTAIITDNEEIYLKRAKPLIEYLLSREKYLFSFTGEQAKQNATWLMDGPCMEVSELSALYDFSGQRSDVFLQLAKELNKKDRVLNLKKITRADNFVNLLSLYQSTGNSEFLNGAIKDADKYVAENFTNQETKISSKIHEENSCFPSDFIPLWVDLYQMYEATGNKKYLDAAHEGANRFATWVWTYPQIPDNNVLINEDGKVYESHLIKNKEYPKSFKTQTQSIPAWRLSQIGLFPESSLTAVENPAVLLAHHAPWFMRIAETTQDTFLYDLARSAVVGRYINYPGYDINYEFNTYIQRPDYPYHEYEDYFTYNQIYFNHVFPQIGILFDYLLSDAYYRSTGQIDFPTQYAQGYAYLQSKVYGHKKGKIYNEENAQLWMPSKLLRSDNIQINYVAARTENDFILVLMNESNTDQNANIQLQADIVPFNYGETYEVVPLHDSKAEKLEMLDGKLSVTIPANGITALKIKGLAIKGFFQDQFTVESAPKLGKKSHTTIDAEFGKINSMLISMGEDLTHTYIWLSSKPEQLNSATLHYRTNSSDAWSTETDSVYPFEFSVPLHKDLKFEWFIEGINKANETEKTETLILEP